MNQPEVAILLRYPYIVCQGSTHPSDLSRGGIMKDLQFSYLQTTPKRSLDGLAIIQSCKKIEGEVLTTGTVVANGVIDGTDHNRFGLKVRAGSFREAELDLSRGAALGLAMDILENFGVSPAEFASWVAERKSANTPGDSSHWFLVD